MLIVSDRPLTIGSETFRASLPFTVEDWRGLELIQAGVARHAVPPEIIYETAPREQNADHLGEQGVTCLCLTRNRRGWLGEAIKSYLAQTHEARELLIVADGDDVRDLIPADRKDIRLIHVQEGWTIGEKRNFGCTYARGEFICHWDDDDWSAPDRIAHQREMLADHPSAQMAGYWSMRFTDGQKWWKFEANGSGYAIGSSFFYRKSYWKSAPFMAKQVGEDGEFMNAAREKNLMVTAEAEHRMVASNHSGNTSPRSWTGSGGRPMPEGVSLDCQEWVARAFA